MRRNRADWMVPTDDLILEYLADEDLSPPKPIAEEIDRHSEYVGGRCRELAKFGLLKNLGRGLYKLTDDGEQYLLGELDANELETQRGDE